MNAPLNFPIAQIDYPDDDGKPMSDNTLQYDWIVTLQSGLAALFRDTPDVFVAGNLLWYAVEGNVKRRTAPDVMVAFGRPKGYRGSYKQWRENGIPPQVVFEVLSPGNRPRAMAKKLLFYETHGAEEYYIYDPHGVKLTGYTRDNVGAFSPIPNTNGYTSPRLGVRFDMSGEELVVVRPDGGRFLTNLELEQRKAVAEQRSAEAEQRSAEAEQRSAEAEQRVAAEKRLTANLAQNLEHLRAKMLAAGLDPDADGP